MVGVVEPTGMEELVVCRIAGQDFKAVFCERHGFREGMTIQLSPLISSIHLFDATNGERIAIDRHEPAKLPRGAP